MEKQNFIIKRIILITLFVIGAGLITGGYIGSKYTDKISREYQPTIAKIEDIKEYTKRSSQTKKNHVVYDVTVSYSVNNKTYTTLLGAYSSSLKIGDNIPIYYNPETPDEIVSVEIDDFVWKVLMVVGLILLLVDCFILPRLLNRVFRRDVKVEDKQRSIQA